jgi:hypothetical protein
VRSSNFQLDCCALEFRAVQEWTAAAWISESGTQPASFSRKNRLMPSSGSTRRDTKASVMLRMAHQRAVMASVGSVNFRMEDQLFLELRGMPP